MLTPPQSTCYPKVGGLLEIKTTGPAFFCLTHTSHIRLFHQGGELNFDQMYCTFVNKVENTKYTRINPSCLCDALNQ